MFMYRLLYFIGVQLYSLLIRLASIRNNKALQWIEGRKDWKQRLLSLSAPHEKKEKTCWMHCASLGEFEQGKPVLAALREKHPTIRIILTFFSPAGYQPRKNTPLADKVLYLPLDSPSNASFFIDTLQPDFAIFVKYEFWYFFLTTLHRKNIPTYLISARFRHNQPFFKPWGSFFRNMLFLYDYIFVQNKESFDLLKKIGVENCIISGDNRVDSVAKNALEKADLPIMNTFVNNRKTFICGSTHPADDRIMISFLNEYLPADWQIIIAPHEIKQEHLTFLSNQLKDKVVLFSSLQQQKDKTANSRILIIDNVGMLSKLYQYARIAYIGGGFGVGIHNLLEPMVFGLPCIFGPNYQKFDEAVFLMEKNAGKSVSDSLSLHEAFQFLTKPENYQHASREALSFIESQRGATELVMTILSERMKG